MNAVSKNQEKKNLQPPSENISKSLEPEIPVIKKRLGRPPKTPTSLTEPAVVKKPLGRQRKSPLAQPVAKPVKAPKPVKPPKPIKLKAPKPEKKPKVPKPKRPPKPPKPKKPKVVKAKKPKPVPKPELVPCRFCNRKLTVKIALKHVCIGKARHNETSEQKYGMVAYGSFVEAMCLLGWRATNISIDKFITNILYTQFIAFGKFMVQNNSERIKEYIMFLVKNNINISKWCSPRSYEVFITELTKVESPDVAIERNFNLMIEWGAENNCDWNKFFQDIKPTQAVIWIMSGRLSPWILYLAPSASVLFDRLSEEQIDLIHSRLDPKFWKAKFERMKEDTKIIRNELERAGL